MARSVSIVIPAFNEALRVGEVLEAIQVQRALSPQDVEVIVVDDGSRDSTAEVVRNHPHDQLIVHETNRGRAAAVQTGIAAATKDYVAVFDADFEYFPEDLFKAMYAVGSGDSVVVYGSRYKNRQNYSSSWGRTFRKMSGQRLGPWAANWLIAIYVFALYGRWYSEHLSGIRLYPAEFLKGYSWTSTGFEGDHELAAAAILSGHKILEVPCAYSARSKEEGKKIRASDGFKAIAVFTAWRFTGKSELRKRRNV